jgi:hypothetical protein
MLILKKIQAAFVIPAGSLGSSVLTLVLNSMITSNSQTFLTKTAQDGQFRRFLKLETAKQQPSSQGLNFG